MPPQPKVTQEDIRNAAFYLAGEGGLAAVNARGIAKRLDCSTQPLFRIYDSMSALMDDLYSYIQSYYDWFMSEYSNPADPFISKGKAHVAFARKEPHLFRMLFMSETEHGNRPLEMMTGKSAEEAAPALAAAGGLSLGNAQALYLEAGIFTHGLASLLVTNPNAFDDQTLSSLLDTVYQSLLNEIKHGETWSYL